MLPRLQIDGQLVYSSLSEPCRYENGAPKYYATVACDPSNLPVLVREAQRAMERFFGYREYPSNLIKFVSDLRNPLQGIPHNWLLIHASTREKPEINGVLDGAPGAPVTVGIYTYAFRGVESIGFGLYDVTAKV